MKKYFTAVTILAFTAVLLMSGSVLADETRGQFERSSREKATVGLFSDRWDDFIDFPFLTGTLTNENYLWTNLANVQSDKIHFGPVNKNFRDNQYSWSVDQKENILGRPGWDSNNSFALGYLGNPVGTEGWNMGFVYNYQTFDYQREVVNSGYSRQNNNSGRMEQGTISADQSYDMLEHLWLLNGGIVLSEELGLGFSWYHWNNDHEWRTRNWVETWGPAGHTYDTINPVTKLNVPEYDYNLEEQGDTLSMGAKYILSEDLAIAGVLDIDYNQTEIDWQSSQVVGSNVTETEGITYENPANFFGNEDRDDFGFDLTLQAVKSWNGEFWQRTEFYLWVGWHPEDGDYWGNKESWGSNYHTVEYDVDGTINYDEFNWGFEAQNFINFGDRIRFAWAISLSGLSEDYNLDYDWVNLPGTNNSSSSAHEYDVENDSYRWSFPVALEVDFVKNLTGRVGARWSLSDSDSLNPHTGWESSYDLGYNPDQTGSNSWYTGDSDTNIDSRNSSTVYSFGLGWRFNEYLQIDLTEFTDLTDMNDWQLSLTLKW